MRDKPNDLVVEAVARALHRADRSGSWDDAADQDAWRRWARIAIDAMQRSSKRAERA